MAQRTVHLLIDDLDGSVIPAGTGERLTFALRDAQFRIDLSEDNVARLDSAMQPFIDAATQVAGRGYRKSKAEEKAARLRAAAIRQWAQENGYHVSRRGRLSTEVVEAFEAAQSENCA